MSVCWHSVGERLLLRLIFYLVIYSCKTFMLLLVVAFCLLGLSSLNSGLRDSCYETSIVPCRQRWNLCPELTMLESIQAPWLAPLGHND